MEIQEVMGIKWLEIIELRAAVNVGQDLIQQQIEEVLNEMAGEQHIMVYINGQVKTDWSIHVKHESARMDARGSKSGRQLKEILKEYGLVNHTVWINEKITN